MEREKELNELEKRLGIPFLSKAILNQSLTHSSFAHEAGIPDNERLEYLGDAVLKLVITEYIYNKFPTKPEGDLTKIRATVISDETLANVADKMNLGRYLLLSENEKRTGGAVRKSNLANSLEALIGAIYLDAGLGRSRDFLLEILRGEIEKVSAEDYIKDFKSVLQEYSQKRKWELPHYRVLSESGPRHKRIFTIGVKVSGKLLGKGSGLSKKEAEQKAAEQAYKKIMSEDKKKNPNRGIRGIISKVKKRIWMP
jgi:ribonuclease-3